MSIHLLFRDDGPKLRIRTEAVCPPIPSRAYDWSAVDDDHYDAGALIGYGATEQEAIEDLLEQLEEEKPSSASAAENQGAGAFPTGDSARPLRRMR